jgi:HEAT repeat protein
MAEQDPDASSHPDAENPGIEDEPEKRIAHYLRMLTDENPASRWKAAESLGRLGDFWATGALIDALFDEDFRVRTKVAWALGSIGDPRALAPLQQLYRMERSDQREIIDEAIAEIKRKMSGQ